MHPVDSIWYTDPDRQVYDMNSQLHTFTYPNGELQRVQLVRPNSWEELAYFTPAPSDKALECFFEIYRKFLVPAAPWVFGSLVLFRLPEKLEVPFPDTDALYGTVSDPLTAAAIGLRKNVRVQKDRIRFRDARTEQFWKELIARDCIRIVRGKLPITRVIPVGNEAGFLTETEPDARLKVNGSFFTMDPFDCATLYDHIGRPFGLFVKNGSVERPPLFSREALLVDRDGTVRVGRPELKDISVRIGSHTFVHGKNAKFFSRPGAAFTPPGKGKRLVIAGRQVIGVRSGGCVRIPGAGFVICTGADVDIKPGDVVTYGGMEDIAFGIQVGNSIIRDGIKTEKFQSRFFNVKGLNRIAFPPCLYPLHFSTDRAARIAIGADENGKPMLLWAEGAAKIGYAPGAGSCGATLSDMARICADLGMVNAVNLDGGGSAQILLGNQRSLKISDRAEDGTETERPVPMGLIVR